MEPAVNPALANMHDIQPPEMISNLPIAMGYWLVLAALCIALVILIVKLKRDWHKRAAKREVLAQLDALIVTQDNSSALPLQINSLIKRAAMSYLSREQVAGLQGPAWYQWMDQQTKAPNPRLIALLDRRYQRTGLTQEEANELKALAHTWLQQALPLKNIQIRTQAQGSEEAQC